MLRDTEMSDEHMQPVKDHENDKGKERATIFSMPTSHDEDYRELVLTSEDLDDEEEWQQVSEAESIAESFCSGQEDEDGEGPGDEDDMEDEMVIERPFADEPQGALLDLSHVESPLEAPRTFNTLLGKRFLDLASGVDSSLEPVSLDNILPVGSKRRLRPASNFE